jgi:hypothetical protein
VTTGFDRVRPRTTSASAVPGEAVPDAQGKRALFSSAEEPSPPGLGTVLVECSRCRQGTVLGVLPAVRASIPGIHLGLRVGHGEHVKVLAVLKPDYPNYARCPACGRRGWLRVTLQL